MIVANIALAIVVFLLCGALVALIVRQKKTQDQALNEDVLARITADALHKNSAQFLLMAKQQLDSQKSEIRTDLEGKKSAINDLITEIRRDISRNEQRLSQSDEERVRSFSSLKKELETYREVTNELKGSTDQLRSLLSNNQLRGQFGEQVAENLLKMAGFVIGQDYVVNKTQETVDTRPDFTIYLPDKTKINIDAKFPYRSLVQYIESKDKEQQVAHLRTFQQDVKAKIKQVTSRDYINPEEKTVDFVILFIPNEMIFSFIYDRYNELWEEAMKRKVILAGPFSFTAILRMIKQAHTNFQYQENLQNIIGLIHKFDSEYSKYSEEVDKLGIRIESASRQFRNVSTTRDRKLMAVVEKIKSEKAIESTPPKPELDNGQ